MFILYSHSALILKLAHPSCQSKYLFTDIILDPRGLIAVCFLNYCKNKSHNAMHRRMKYTYAVFFYVLIFTSSTMMGGVFIVVHGTWSSAAKWYIPGSNFFDVLEHH